MVAYEVIAALEERKDFSAYLKDRIRAFNDRHSVMHAEKRKAGAVQSVNLIVSDGARGWIGGLTAEVYWGWLDIRALWLHEDYRGQGLGTALLRQAEDMARRIGAAKALLSTFEFQARSFYERRGYAVACELKDYPPGSSYYTMVKEL